MRYIDILDEATAENITVVRELADIVTKAMPDTPKGENSNLYLSNVPGFDTLYKKYQDHEKFKKSFQFMETTEIRFINDPAYIDKYYKNDIDKYGGYYSDRDNLILVVLFNRVWNSGIKNTLIHEFRHLFQHSAYPKYFNSLAAYKKPYEEQHIELDATWSDLIGSGSPEGMQGAESEYADDIMDSMSSIKKLSPKLADHYRKKTIKYAREFFMHNFEVKWKKLLQYYNDDINPEIYSMNDWIGDLMGQVYNLYEYELGRYPTTKEETHYRNILRKLYMDRTATSRNKKRVKELQNKLFPSWSNAAEKINLDIDDKSISKFKLASDVMNDMDAALRSLAKTPDEYKDLSTFFYKFTIERIDAARSWQK